MTGAESLLSQSIRCVIGAKRKSMTAAIDARMEPVREMERQWKRAKQEAKAKTEALISMEAALGVLAEIWGPRSERRSHRDDDDENLPWFVPLELTKAAEWILAIRKGENIGALGEATCEAMRANMAKVERATLCVHMKTRSDTFARSALFSISRDYASVENANKITVRDPRWVEPLTTRHRTTVSREVMEAHLNSTRNLYKSARSSCQSNALYTKTIVSVEGILVYLWPRGSRESP